MGVVGIGYGDGYPREAPSGTPVLINDRPAGLAGRVSMDMLAIDLRAHPDARIGDAVPWFAPFIPVILMAYMVFAVLTWTSDAIFNTLLRFHPFGRHLLTTKMIWRSNLVASCLICAAGGATIALATGHWFAAVVVAFYWMLMCVPATAAFAMPTVNRSLVIVVPSVSDIQLEHHWASGGGRLHGRRRQSQIARVPGAPNPIEVRVPGWGTDDVCGSS